MALPASDNFNRADENPLAGNWTTVTGIGALKILSNEVTNVTNGTDSAALWNADTFANNQSSKATITNIGFTCDVGAAARISSSATSMYVSSSWKSGEGLVKFVSGTYSNVKSVTVADFVNNDVVGIECEGTTIRYLKNGTVIDSATDSSLTSGSPGLFFYEQACRLDNWQGDNIPATVIAATRKPYNYNTKQLRNNNFRKQPFRYFAVPGTNAAAAPTHTTSGVLTGQLGTIVGSAAHKAKHTTTGVLAGLVSAIAGTARRFRSHATSGVLTGQGSTIAGSSAHKAKHTTTGVLTGQGSSIVGSSAHNPSVSHVTTGVLTGQLGSIVGAARRFRSHVTSGVLAGQASSIVGSAAHKAKHTTTGVLAGLVATIAGSARRFRSHATTGALVGQSSTIVGSAARNPSGVTHATSGVLTGQASSIVGAARRFRAHITSGVLAGQSSSIVGASAHKAKHATTGALVGQSASVVGAAQHKAKHTTTGALIGLGAIIAGIATNGTSVITKRFGVAYWKPVEKDEPIPEEEDVEIWTEPDLFEKLKETRTKHEAIVKKAQQAELMEEQQKIRLRKAQDDQIIEMYLRSKR